MRRRAAAVVAVALSLPAAAGCGRASLPGATTSTVPGPASDRPEPLDADQLAAASAAAAFLRGPTVPAGLADTEVGRVRVLGTRASVQVVRPGAADPAGTLRLVLRRGAWRVAEASRG